METTELTKQEAIQKILVVREQMEVKLREIEELDKKRKTMWNEIKDFASADAIKAARGEKFIRKMNAMILSLEQSVAADRKRIKKIEKGKDE